MAKILVVAEQRAGSLHPATPQLITAANQMDAAADIVACVVGSGIDTAVDTMAKSGVSKVIRIDNPALERYSPLSYAAAAQAAIEQEKPQVVLLAATFMGRDLAPRVAARLKAAIATDCVELKLDADALIVKRPVYMGKATAELRLSAERLKIVSVRPNTFAAADATGAAEISSLDASFSTDDARLENREWVSTSSGVKDVTEADIVVSGGRSLKSEENFKILYDLAEVLDAAVGASRAACDAGYQPHSRQVGLTGKTVTPKLYLAFGIDGAIQHLAGMRGSKCIVAINTKKEAPIFGVSTYGCVADLFDLAPLLTEEFKAILK